MNRLVITGVCVAISVILSTVSIPVGSAKIFPFQHMMNVILAILLGGTYAVGGAFSTSVLRNVLALGSPLAFPGSMIGAFFSSILYKRIGKLWAAVLGEIIGTGLFGAILSYPVAAFLMGKEMAITVLILSFSMSSIGGAILGAFVVKLLPLKALKL